MTDRVFNQPPWRIITLQHISFVVTKTYLFISNSKIIARGNTTPQPDREYIVASTHVSWFDPFMVSAALGWKQIRPLLPFRYIASPVFLNIRLISPMMFWLGSFPSHPYHDLPYGIEASDFLLKKGHTVVIFPQGKRTTGGRLPAKRGVAELAKAENRMVIPALISFDGLTFGFIPRYTIYTGSAFAANDLDADAIMSRVYALK